MLCRFDIATSSRRLTWAAGSVCWLATWLLPGLATAATSLEYATSDPEIEMWFYPFSTANGTGSVRDRASTFSWYTPQDGFPDITGTGLDPIRRGSFVVVSDTSETIPRLEDPSRYSIDSLRVELTMLGSIGSGSGAYDGTPDDGVALLAGEDEDEGQPVEMYGIGFDGDYTTFGFQGESEPEYFNEGDRRWPIAGGSFTGPYQLYGIDTAGRDVSNNMSSGGYSATQPDHTNDIFNATPYAVGKVYDDTGQEIAPGTAVGQGTVFEFEPNLDDPAVLAYVQQSLSAGHLGFYFSSLHEPNGHAGDVFYPDFYLDNNPSGPNPNGDGPTMELQVSIVDPPLAGDYDGNGTVDALDYQAWRGSFGHAVEAGSGADGNGDGVVDAADYTVWRDNLGASLDSAAPQTGHPVPEPAAMVLLLTAAGWMPRRPRAVRPRAGCRGVGNSAALHGGASAPGGRVNDALPPA